MYKLSSLFYGWRMVATSFALSLARAEGAIEGPIIGRLLSRFGPRPVSFGNFLYLARQALDAAKACLIPGSKFNA